MVYVILGMHKSGTTLVAETLHKSGIDMVEEADQDQDYQTGNKYERLSCKEINKDILGCTDLESLDTLEDLQVSEISAQQEKQIQQVIQQCNNSYDQWGFKDPRTCITYPVWKQYLPEDHKLIVVYRHPYQVMHHYLRNKRLDDKLVRTYKSVKGWKSYNNLLLNILNTTDQDTFVFNYQDFMNDGSILEALSQFCGLPMANTIQKSNYHNQKTNNSFIKLLDLPHQQKALDIYHDLESFRSLSPNKAL
ncbi:sulfotransferase [Tunicatimonas pelagia]|uniref:sulfotransferase n=1 Tax=Tunicatimonas pelagia TaxID=931531 RepID=UPI00266690F1|nr:sulfotransferase [Tunicatimonas pelagia]WKN41972.1 sulfotransferase [Tunicatimonas pelagia]